MKEKYILGGGITGLVISFYNPDYTILTNQIGGQINSHFELGPRYLHFNKYNKKLVEDLGLRFNIKKVKVGFVDQWQYVKPTLTFRKRYYKKSRNETNLKGFNKNIMNDNKSDFLVIDINCKKIINELKNRLKERIKICNIKNINIQQHIINTNKEIFHYQKIISTIPLNFLYQMCNKTIKSELKSQSITYALFKNIHFDMKNFDFVYCLGHDFHRLTKTFKGIVGEFAIPLPLRYKFKIKEKVIIPNAQIIDINYKEKRRIKKQFYKYNIILSGRYAEWKKSYKIEDSVKFAIKKR